MGATEWRANNGATQARLTVMLILGTVLTFWNVHNVLYQVLSVRVVNSYERQAALTFAPRLLEAGISKMANYVDPTVYHYHGSSIEVNIEPKKIYNGLSGRAHLGHEYFLFSPPGTKNLTRWSLDRRLRSYTEGGVTFNEGCLVARESGYYFVYSQVSFVKALRDWKADQSSVTHELIRLSNATHEAQTLLRVQKTHSWDTQLRCSLDSSYLGAAFFLQKGDKIFVAVSDANFIWQSPRRTYFGMRSL